MSGRLDAESIGSALGTERVGRRIECLERVGSTNDVVWARALEGEAEGLVVFAEEQKRGRGRLRRRWFGLPGGSLLGSVLLRPELRLAEVNFVTVIGALAVAEAVEDAAALQARIRFPNDVLIGGRKVSGVLVEARLISSRPDFFVVGIGINVNIPRETFPEEIRTEATSLQAETGREFDRVRLARALLRKLDDWYGVLGTEAGHQRIEREWRARSAVLGREVEVREGGWTVRGKVEEVDVLNGLVIRTESGLVRHVRAEHIESLRIVGDVSGRSRG